MNKRSEVDAAAGAGFGPDPEAFAGAGAAGAGTGGAAGSGAGAGASFFAAGGYQAPGSGGESNGAMNRRGKRDSPGGMIGGAPRPPTEISSAQLPRPANVKAM
jgi:hypothetical protein